MKQFDTNSNDLLNNLKQNLSPEEAEKLLFLERDINYIKGGTETEGLLLDNRDIAQNLLNDFQQIMSKELFKTTLLILLFVFVSTFGVFNDYWDTGTSDTASLMPVYETQKETFSTSKTDDNNTGNATAAIEKTGVVPLKRPATEHRTKGTRTENTTPLLTLSFKPVISTLPTTRISSLDFNSSVIRSNNLISSKSTKINAFTLNKIKGNWIPLIGKEPPTNNYQQDYINTHSNHNQEYSSSLRLELYKEHQKGLTETIKIPSFKGNEITLLSACISGYQETDMKVKKDMILFISSHGTISLPECGMSLAPEGIRSVQDQLIHCEPFIKEFDTGALLYRFGHDDNWKAYSATQGNIVAEKEGLLEFFINISLPDKKKLSGHYAVAVSTSQLNLNR